MIDLITKLQHLVTKKIDGKNLHGIAVKVEKGNGEVIFKGSSGNLGVDTQYFIASTTKIYITALIMKLVSEDKISLDDTLEKFFSDAIVSNLNNFRGTDYCSEITIRNLLAHTSGIPDYFMGKLPDGTSLLDSITQGKDQTWTFEDALTMAKSQSSGFKPNQKGRALYSDTNFQILGRIVEIVRDSTIAEVLMDEIFKPLGLGSTYLYVDSEDKKPLPLYYKDKTLNIPKAMTSFKADGGIVSTLDDCMKFVKAFFDGSIFPKSYLEEMTVEFNRIFFPLQYGVGLMKFDFPSIFTLFRKTPILLGHSGLSGAFSYYSPQLDLYICGTVNQIAYPSNSYRMLVEVMQMLKNNL